MIGIKFKIWDKKEEKLKELTSDVTLEFDDEKFLIRSWELYDNKILGYKDRFIPLLYTGRKDVNGREIFEKDLVKTELYNESCKNNKEIFIGYVTYHRGRAEWRVVNSKGYVQLGYNDFEKIGNKYVNPELIENE
jgi:hypothetical protein